MAISMSRLVILYVNTQIEDCFEVSVDAHMLQEDPFFFGGGGIFRYLCYSWSTHAY